MKCPRCQSELIKDYEDAFCLKCFKTVYLRDGKPVEYGMVFKPHAKGIEKRFEPKLNLV